MKKTICIILANILLFNLMPISFAETSLELNAPSAILLDKEGNIIFEKNADEQREPASVTKIMTMLLAMENLENGKIEKDDIVVVSSLAESQGGSQVFLEAGEEITVHELLKSIAVSSANDASIALGEYIAGTNEEFVRMMNEKSSELGMENTYFINCNGLPEDGHLSTARDIAIMSVELLKYDDIYDYTTIWMDSIRNSEFELANTNKMLKTYNGMVGLKTGYTNNALYCISATAIRNGEQFIAVTMGNETVDERTKDIETMLDYAFANYKTIGLNIDEELENQFVSNGQSDTIKVKLSKEGETVLANKNSVFSYEISFKEELKAPISVGEPVGEVKFFVDETEVLIVDILSFEEVLEINFKYIMRKYIVNFFKIS